MKQKTEEDEEDLETPQIVKELKPNMFVYREDLLEILFISYLIVQNKLIGSWEWLSKHYKISQGSRSSGWTLPRRRDEEAKGPLEAYTTRICLPNLCKQEEHFGEVAKMNEEEWKNLRAEEKAPLERGDIYAEGYKRLKAEEEDKEALQVLKKENIVACSADNSQEIYYDQREDGDKNIVTCSTVFPYVDNMLGFVLLPIQPEEHFGGCEDERRRVEELVCGTKGSLRKGLVSYQLCEA
ncbi:unnamed protein product [Arabidopsis arenosa]|uniref:Uncharacterized protein n=1 Tax=Arabidopsis arenosa TaxID=38785 RepID=A0A8S2A2Q7_ARAAE|nr:unnamed protein product [Arabidopsis arenosa]